MGLPWLSMMLYLSSFSFFQNPDMEKGKENDKPFLSSSAC